MPDDGRRDDFEQPLVDLIETYHDVNARNALESYHDAQQALDMAMNLFSGGYLSLEQRCARREPVLGDLREDAEAGARAWTTCPRICRALDEMLSDTYFCNFSLFQSIPDSWAIKQLFPVMPIHRLDERPTHHAVHRRHHLRLRRQDRSVHRSPRRQEDAAAAPASTASRTTSACSWSAPTRRSSATCTTCSATPTPCTSASTTPTNVVRRRRHQGRHGPRGARLRRVRRRAAGQQVAPRRRSGGPRRPHRRRRDRAPAPLLRRRPAGLHLPGRSAALMCGGRRPSAPRSRHGRASTPTSQLPSNPADRSPAAFLGVGVRRLGVGVRQ